MGFINTINKNIQQEWNPCQRHNLMLILNQEPNYVKVDKIITNLKSIKLWCAPISKLYVISIGVGFEIGWTTTIVTCNPAEYINISHYCGCKRAAQLTMGCF